MTQKRRTTIHIDAQDIGLSPTHMQKKEGKLRPETDEPFLIGNTISEAFGFVQVDLQHMLFDQIRNIGCTSKDKAARDTSAALAILQSIKPRDELEALLIAQMIGIHNAAMAYMRIGDVDKSSKMARTFTTQLEALSRYRGKGQQRVIVEHVTVNQGGQAIVGSVEREKKYLKANIVIKTTPVDLFIQVRRQP
jgi:hypothetical protein